MVNYHGKLKRIGITFWIPPKMEYHHGRICYEDFKFYAKSRDVIVLSNSYHGEFENAKRCGSLL